MVKHGNPQLIALPVATASLGWASGPAAAAVQIDARVQALGGVLAGSTMRLSAARAKAPARSAQAATGADRRFVVSLDQSPDGSILQLVATGGTPSAGTQAGNTPALARPAVAEGNPPAPLAVNTFTTAASVPATARLPDAAATKGNRLALPTVMASLFGLSRYLPCPDF